MNDISSTSDSRPHSRRGFSRLLGMIIALVLLDQLSKLWAISTLQNAPVLSWAGDVFRIVYAENSGAFLSLGSQLSEMTRFFVMVVFNAIMLLAVAIYIWKKREMPRGQRTILGIILAGGIGNLIDRVCYDGVVIDFLNIGIGSQRSGIFNLADVWVSGGVVALFCLSFMEPKEVEETEAEAETEAEKKNSVADSSSISTVSLMFLIGCCSLLVPASDLAADTVIHRAGKRGGRVAISGEILDYNSQKMTFRVKSPDTIRELKQSQILVFDAQYMTSHRDAIREIEIGNYEKASLAVKKAINAEARPWVRRELMALAVQCAINLDDWSTAASHYVAMKQSDPYSRHLDIIPLQWTRKERSQIDRNFAIRELTSTNQTAQLIAASWLLQRNGTEKKATTTLNELLQSPEGHLRYLARCQLWRTRISSDDLTDGEMVRWEKQLRNLPESYWAGPMFLLAQGYTKRVQPDLAAARYLWITVIDPRNANLAREATLNAAQLLESLGQKKASTTLRTEAEQRFSLKYPPSLNPTN